MLLPGAVVQQGLFRGSINGTFGQIEGFLPASNAEVRMGKPISRLKLPVYNLKALISVLRLRPSLPKILRTRNS